MACNEYRKLSLEERLLLFMTTLLLGKEKRVALQGFVADYCCDWYI